MKKTELALLAVGIVIGIILAFLFVMICCLNSDHPWSQPAPAEEQITVPPQESPLSTDEITAPDADTEELSAVNPLAAELFQLTNKIRVSRGLTELAYAGTLQEAADARAYESSVSFSHTRPNGKPCQSVVEAYDYYVTGENLLKADKALAVAEIMMSEWMTSEGHRANILLPEFTELAVGIYEKNGVVYAAQIFMG